MTLMKYERKEDITLKLHLIQQGKRFEGDRYLRDQVCKGNTGEFYCQLYAALFGGETSPRFKGEPDILSNGELRNFHPDIRRQEREGEVLVEVKSCSYRDKRPRVSLEQTENYFYLLYKRLSEQEQKLPEVETAMFRYGRKSKHPFLLGSSSQTAVRKLTSMTRDLVVIPPNLLMLGLYFANRASMDKSSSKSCTKCIVNERYPTWFLTTLNMTQDPIDVLCSMTEKGFETNFGRGSGFRQDFRSLSQREREKIILEDLMIDKLKVMKTSSEAIVQRISWDGVEVKPFQVRKFFMKRSDRLKWLEKFMQEHRYMLEELLEIRDLYEETTNSDSREPTIEEITKQEVEGVPF